MSTKQAAMELAWNELDERQREVYMGYAATTDVIEPDRQGGGEPVAFAKDGVLFWHGNHAARRGFDGELYLGPQPAEPVKVPSDEEIRDTTQDLWEAAIRCDYAGFKAVVASMLTAPGQSAQPAASADYCTDPENCRRCQTIPEHRGDMRHAGIGSYPSKPTVPTPPADEQAQQENPQ